VDSTYVRNPAQARALARDQRLTALANHVAERAPEYGAVTAPRCGYVAEGVERQLPIAPPNLEYLEPVRAPHLLPQAPCPLGDDPSEHG
jgi:hypothetical protein